MNESSQIFEVFYDQDCPLCRREIDFIRKRDRDGRLRLTNISSQTFDPSSTGRTLDELMREIHGRYSDGTLITGVEVFREIYCRIGFGKLVMPTRIPGITWLMDRCYNLFAALRYRAAMKRAKGRTCPLPSRPSSD